MRKTKEVRRWHRLESARRRRVFQNRASPAIPERKRLMKTIESERSATAYSGWNSFKPINFYYYAPEAKSVHFTSDFNQWTPVAMRQRPEGWWYLQVELPHGHHHYRYLVDGTPTLDPQATGVGRDEANEVVSIIAVS
jgi:1,4-alpha-glucan branching enzyme